jgi:uncharacterized protein (DUF3820 family)
MQVETVLSLINDEIIDHTIHTFLSVDGEQKKKLEDYVRERLNRIISNSLSNNITMPFGKYKGRSVKSVYVSDANYLRWCYQKCTFLEKFPDLKPEIENLLRQSVSS